MRHVGMAERGGGLGFLHEAPHAIGIVRHFRRQNLQGDGTIEIQILGKIHLAHAARAQLGDDAVVSQRRTGRERFRHNLYYVSRNRPDYNFISCPMRAMATRWGSRPAAP